MNHNIEQLINLLLNKSEQLEESLKKNSQLKDLTTRQLQCIEAVLESQNPTLSELAKKLYITKPSATVLIDRLNDHGYLIKIKSDNDRRSAHVHLTEKGEMSAKLHSKVHERFAKLITKDMTDSEVEILAVLLNKAIKAFN